MTEEREENIFIQRRRADIEGLEQAEQKIFHLIEIADTYSIPEEEKKELKESLRFIRTTILHLNQMLILEKRKEERRQQGERRIFNEWLGEGDRRQTSSPRRQSLRRS